MLKFITIQYDSQMSLPGGSQGSTDFHCKTLKIT